METTTMTINREFDVILEPERAGGVELKTFQIRNTNVGDGADDKGLIDVEIGGKSLIVKCDLVQVVHGFLCDDWPATLAVFQFAFVPRGNFRRFIEAEITITFSAGSVEAIAPSETWAISKSETQQEVSHTVNPSIEAAYGPASANVGYTWQLTKTDKLTDQARVQGLTRALGQNFGRRKRTNTVFWGLYENETTRSSIPSFMQGAVLLRRNKVDGDPLGEKFSAEINIYGKTDLYTSVKDKLGRLSSALGLSGRNIKGESIMFDPKKSRGSTVKDPNNLLDEDLEAYKSLVTMREWVDGNPKPAPEAANGGPSLSAANADLSLSTATLVDPAEMAKVEAPKVEVTKVEVTKVEAPKVESPKVVAKVEVTKVESPKVESIRVEAPKVESPKVEVIKIEAPKDPVTGSGEGGTKKLAELRDQLSTIRTEANLLRRLLFLHSEEQKIVQEINKLEGIC